jgi:hypothetical protein
MSDVFAAANSTNPPQEPPPRGLINGPKPPAPPPPPGLINTTPTKPPGRPA